MNPRRPRSQFVALVVIGLVVAVGLRRRPSDQDRKR
ncbi:hypothetical protein J2Y42_002328 [Leifsonia sp. 1010]|nr:hypothetical protein [Leifsonia sp. 1010]